MVSKRFARDACARILRPETSASRIFSPGPKRTTGIAHASLNLSLTVTYSGLDVINLETQYQEAPR